MATSNQDHVYTDGLKALQERMENTFNNANIGDTEFTVKECKFYALSQMVALSSPVLNDIINLHYATCDDKNIKLYGIKCEESFSIILRYMYGLDINFSQMNLTVMCEVISLAERFMLIQFSQDLKHYLAKVTNFQIDSLAVLLNTAKNYNLQSLYEKLSLFAYHNAVDFVKHDTVVNLRYEVLLDLIKSDWFCAPEFDILTGILKWQDDMLPKRIKTAHEADDENYFGVDKKDINSNRSWFGSESDESPDIEDDTKEDSWKIENKNISKHLDKLLSKQDDESYKASTSNATTTNTVVVKCFNQNDKFSEVMKSFSDNILKSLLLHIRIDLIPAVYYDEARRTELFAKYKQILDDKKYFRQTSKPREKYVATCTGNNDIPSEPREEYVAIYTGNNDVRPRVICTGNNDIPSEPREEYVAICTGNNDGPSVSIVSKDFSANLFRFCSACRDHLKPNVIIPEDDLVKKLKFTNERVLFRANFLTSFNKKISYTKSVDTHFIGGLRFGIGARIPESRSSKTSLMMFLHCSSVKPRGKWNCQTKCHLSLISRNGMCTSEKLPVTSLIFDQNHSLRYLGEFQTINKDHWQRAFESKKDFILKVVFKSIIIKQNQ